MPMNTIFRCLNIIPSALDSFCSMGYISSWSFPKSLVGKNYLIVAIDHFTRWVEVRALATITARKVKEFFYEDVICKFGIPKILIMTEENNLTPKNFKIFMKTWALSRVFTSVGCPQTNGATEITNRTF